MLSRALLIIPATSYSPTQFPAGSSKADYVLGERYFQRLAEMTGGRVYEANKDLTYLRDAFSRIALELSRQYTLGYYPIKREGFGERRQIKVRVNRSDVVVLARGSHFYKGGMKR